MTVLAWGIVFAASIIAEALTPPLVSKGWLIVQLLSALVFVAAIMQGWGH